MIELDQILVGTLANDKTGDPLRNAFQKVNANMVTIAQHIDDLEAGNGNMSDFPNGTQVLIRDTRDVTDTTGALHVFGGVQVDKNIYVQESVFIGTGSNVSELTEPVFIARRDGVQFIQGSIINTSAFGSADYAAYADTGDETQGFIDMGFTGSEFNDSNYTHTGPGDGYLIVQGLDDGTSHGELHLATGEYGTTKDIVLSTGGFLVENEKLRLVHETGSLLFINGGEISPEGEAGVGLNSLVLKNNAFIIQSVVQGSPVQFTRTAEGSQTDEIDTGLTLARGSIRGLYNIESEEAYNNATHTSPAGTEWNADGWGDLLNIGARSYTTLHDAMDGAIGENIVGAELIMHDTINDKYYKFLFTNWGENNGGSFAYTRTLITDPNYFRKEDDGDEVDIFVANTPPGSGIGITRSGQQGIFNPYQDEGWSSEVSPTGTEWNLDGWNDLSNITTRTYTNFYDAFGSGGLGNKVVGTECVMYIPSTEEYYAIKFLQWTQNGNGGGFSYLRYKLDLDLLQEGVRFADGTVQKTAYVPTRVKSTAPGDRRIEEVSGSATVSVTGVSYGEVETTTVSRTSTNWDFYVDATETLNTLYETSEYRFIEFSFDDGSTWIKTTFGGGTQGVEYQMVFEDGIYRPATEDAIVSYRVVTGGEAVTWWSKEDLPNGGGYFRGAIIDYHAFTGESTIIGTIHIVDDDGEDHISHQEVQSGDTDGENDDLWYVTSEGRIRYRRLDGESKTLKVHWTAKVFYGSEYYD